MTMKTALAILALSFSITAQLFPPPAPPLPELNATVQVVGSLSENQPAGTSGMVAQSLGTFAHTAHTAYVAPPLSERAVRIGGTLGVATNTSVLVSPMDWPLFAWSFGPLNSAPVITIPGANPLFNVVGIDPSNFVVVLPQWELVQAPQFGNMWFIAITVPNDLSLVGSVVKVQALRTGLGSGPLVFSVTRRVRVVV